MPLLGGLLVTLFSGLASYLSAWMAKKAAFAVAAIATFGLLTVALIAALQALVAGVVLAFPEVDPVVLSIVWMVLPDNATTCVGIAIAADTAIALYRWNVENLRLATAS